MPDDAGQRAFRATPSFQGLLDGGPPKDADVIIVEEGAVQSTPATGRKRPRSKANAAQDAPGITVPCHQLVLYSLSSFFQNKLDRWSDTDGNDSGRKQLQLLVPPGQQELGQRLIAAMYADQPELSDLSAHQLVQLTLLAESYDVSKVVAAAAEAMGRLRPEQLTPEAISSVLLLPDSCLELDCFNHVKVKAGNQLQWQFGDLEVVWADEEKAEQLLQLPFAAILQLADDTRTLASEDTIVYTLGRWLDEHPDTSSKQKEQLAGSVRLVHCSASFLSSTSATGWLREAGYTEQDLCTACVLQGKTRKQQAAWVSTYCSSRTAWNLARRAGSSKWSGKLEWNVPLADVRRTFEAVPDDGKRTLDQPAPGCIWHGREWGLTLQFKGASSNLGLYLMTLCGTRVAANFKLTACRTAGHGESLVRESQGALFGDGACNGFYCFVQGPSGNRDWATLEASLRQQGLVQADGCLHLRASVSCVT